MNLLRAVVKEVVSLFVDDGNLALYIVVLIALAAGLVELLHAPGLWAGSLLLVGCIVILLESVIRAARRR